MRWSFIGLPLCIVIITALLTTSTNSCFTIGCPESSFNFSNNVLINPIGTLLNGQFFSFFDQFPRLSKTLFMPSGQNSTVCQTIIDNANTGAPAWYTSIGGTNWATSNLNPANWCYPWDAACQNKAGAKLTSHIECTKGTSGLAGAADILYNFLLAIAGVLMFILGLGIQLSGVSFSIGSNEYGSRQIMAFGIGFIIYGWFSAFAFSLYSLPYSIGYLLWFFLTIMYAFGVYDMGRSYF